MPAAETPRFAAPRSYAAVLAALIAVGALAVLAACSPADPRRPAVPIAAGSARSSSTAPTTRTTATATGTAAAVDPVLIHIPPAARPETEGGAHAFAKYFFDSLNSAAVHGDPDRLAGLFGGECKTCIAMHGSLGDLKASGHHHEKPAIRIVSVATDSFATERRVILIGVDQSAVRVEDSQGRITSRTIAGRGTFAMTLRYGPAHWIVARLQVVGR